MADLEEIRLMVEGGMSVSDIALELDVTPARVSQLITAMGLSDSVVRKSSLSRLSTEQVAAIIEAYQNGASVVELCVRYRLSYNAFYRLLIREGIEFRDRSGEAREARVQRVDQAIRLYIRNVPLAQIEAETGVRQPMLHREIHLRGIPLRGRALIARGKRKTSITDTDDIDLPDMDALTQREIAILDEGDLPHKDDPEPNPDRAARPAVPGPGGFDDEKENLAPDEGAKNSGGSGESGGSGGWLGTAGTTAD